MRALITFFSALFLTLYIGCSSNDPGGSSNNPPSNDSIIYQTDSIFVTGISFNLDTTINVRSYNADSIRIVFYVETNCDSTDNPSFGFSIVDTLGGIVSSSYSTLNYFNSLIQINHSKLFNPFILNIVLRDISAINRYMYLRKFIVYKVK